MRLCLCRTKLVSLALWIKAFFNHGRRDRNSCSSRNVRLCRHCLRKGKVSNRARHGCWLCGDNSHRRDGPRDRSRWNTQWAYLINVITTNRLRWLLLCISQPLTAAIPQQSKVWISPSGPQMNLILLYVICLMKTFVIDGPLMATLSLPRSEWRWPFAAHIRCEKKD